MISDATPVFWLTMRQFLDGRSIRVVAVLATVPLLLSGIEIIASGQDASAGGFLGPLFNELSIPTLLPIIALVLASTALGNELSDRTIPYIVLKPWSRLRLIVEKLGATVATGALIAITLAFVAWGALALVGSSADEIVLVAMILASVLAVSGYAAAFSLLSLMISRVLLAGLIYILFWESLLARFIPGIRLLSIRHYVQSVYVEVLDEPRVTVSQQSAMLTSLIVLTVMVVACILLTRLRLQRMDLD
jgi:ABC-2 type transport system permease protein